MRFLVLGSMNIDNTFSVEHIVREGETISSHGMSRSAGGKGANQSASLAKAGANVCFAGKCGSDGRWILDLLKTYGVDVSLSIVGECNTGMAMIQVDDKGQNSIVLDAGGNRLWQEDEVKTILSSFNEGDVIVLQNEINLLPLIIEEAKRRGMIVVLNPSPFDNAISSLPLDSVDWFFVNEIEGKALTGEDGFDEILNAFKKLYPGASIVLTCGKKGAYAMVGGDICYQEIIDYPVVDTTGAGDTFLGFFLSSFLRGESAEKSLLTATKASAIAVSRKGAMSAIPLKEEVI